jgi:large subunit ribosomal protein L25
MASNAKLSAEPRDGRGKGMARKLRAEGRLPAVVYGHGESTRHLSLDAHEVEQLFDHVHYENTVFLLDIAGERGEVRALVREVQRHAHKRRVLHVDFQQIHRGEKVHVSIPVRLVGAAPGVRAGGLMQHTTTDLEVRCAAESIPDQIDIDVSKLEIGDSVHLRDVTPPAGVEFTDDGDRTICSVSPPAVAPTDEAAEPAETPGGEPEVIRRRREDEEESED